MSKRQVFSKILAPFDLLPMKCLKTRLTEKLESYIYHLFIDYLSFQIVSNWQEGVISVLHTIVDLTPKTIWRYSVFHE